MRRSRKKCLKVRQKGMRIMLCSYEEQAIFFAPALLQSARPSWGATLTDRAAQTSRMLLAGILAGSRTVIIILYCNLMALALPKSVAGAPRVEPHMRHTFFQRTA